MLRAQVDAVEVTVHKPKAPIEVTFSDGEHLHVHEGKGLARIEADGFHAKQHQVDDKAQKAGMRRDEPRRQSRGVIDAELRRRVRISNPWSRANCSRPAPASSCSRSGSLKT